LPCTEERRAVIRRSCMVSSPFDTSLSSSFAVGCEAYRCRRAYPMIHIALCATNGLRFIHACPAPQDPGRQEVTTGSSAQENVRKAQKTRRVAGCGTAAIG
jgi:hypothetical protein